MTQVHHASAHGHRHVEGDGHQRVRRHRQRRLGQHLRHLRLRAHYMSGPRAARTGVALRGELRLAARGLAESAHGTAVVGEVRQLVRHHALQAVLAAAVQAREHQRLLLRAVLQLRLTPTARAASLVGGKK